MTREWAESVDRWLLVLRAAGHPDGTVKLRRRQLHQLARWAPAGPWSLTGEDLIAFAGTRVWERETRRSWRAAVRGFYGWAHAAGLVEVDPALALPTVPATRPNPRPTPADVYRLALASADERVRLMLRISSELGLRRAEVAVIHALDLEVDLDGWTLVVHGKGSRHRRVPMSDSLAAAVRLRMTPSGYLFPGRADGHLSPGRVGKLVSEAMPPGWTMHTLRHKFASAAYGVERDTFTVQELLGHASPVTTRRYVRVPSESLRRTVAAVAALDLVGDEAGAQRVAGPVGGAGVELDHVRAGG